MEKKTIVIVDTDEMYIAALEYRLLESWHEFMEISVITDLKYFSRYFSQSHRIDILIINEQLYNDTVQKQNCDYVFLLREDDDKNSENIRTANDSVSQVLQKYSDIREIMASIMRITHLTDNKRHIERTQMYMVYSPIGGCGKTICALGLCMALSEYGRKVLYINAESIQNFNYYLKDQRYADASLGYTLGKNNIDLQREIYSEIGSEQFDFLRPLEWTLVSYQLTEQNFFNLAEQISNARIYDDIVVEASTEFSFSKAQWMGKIDKVLLIAQQSQLAVKKITDFLKNVSCSKEQFLIVCNRLVTKTENFLKTEDISIENIVCEYIEQRNEDITLEKMKNQGVLKTTAYMLS